MNSATYLIPQQLLPSLQKKVARINKRAAKLSQTLVEMKQTGRTEERNARLVHGRYGREYSYTVEEVVVTGNTPIIAGWEFVGVIRHRPAGNEIHQIPSWATDTNIDFSDYTFAERKCDHCNKARVRNATYLVYSQTEGLKQVGSDCLGDFTGYDDPQAAAKACENIFKFFADLKLAQATRWQQLRTARKFNRLEWLAFVAQQIREHGWVSRARSYDTGEDTTSYRAKRAIIAYYNDENVAVPTAEDFAKAQIADDWAHSDAHAQMDAGDFKDQFLASFAPEYVTEHEMGITAAVFACMARAEREAAKASEPVSSHQGAIGDRLTIVAKVERTHSFMGSYGPTTVYNLLDSYGNKYVWFNTGRTSMAEGETHTIEGKVKAHDIDRYSNAPQTVLTRCKLLK